MKTRLTITFSLLFSYTFGQSLTNISGRIVDETGNFIYNAALHYGKDNVNQNTSYTDRQGRFNLAYPNPQQFWYFFYIEKDGFLPKSVLIDISPKDIILKNPIILRSRKGFWYDSKQIDSTHIGITVREAIKKYKLDTTQCFLSNEPIGTYRGFSTEFADSSEVFFSIKSFFSKTRIKMIDILDLKITGFGIADTKGNERVVGAGHVRPNPYFAEHSTQ